MVQFICLFFPGIISVMIIERKRKGKMSHRQFLSYYIFFTLIINLFAFIIFWFLYPPFIISSEAFNTKFAAKYILLLFFLAVVSAYSMFAISYIRYHFSFRLWCQKIINIINYIRYHFAFKLFHQKIDNTEKKHDSKAVIWYVISILILFFISFLYFGVKWVFSSFSFLSIDEFIFHLLVPLEGAGKEMVNNILIKIFFPSLITIIIYFVLTGIYFYHGIINVGIKINDKIKSISILPFKLLKKYNLPIIILLFASVIVYSGSKFGFKILYNYFFSNSKFIEENYTDTKNVNLIFPEKKT